MSAKKPRSADRVAASHRGVLLMAVRSAWDPRYFTLEIGSPGAPVYKLHSPHLRLFSGSKGALARGRQLVDRRVGAAEPNPAEVPAQENEQQQHQQHDPDGVSDAVADGGAEQRENDPHDHQQNQDIDQ
jgi:hypothetical protein